MGIFSPSVICFIYYLAQLYERNITISLEELKMKSYRKSIKPLRAGDGTQCTQSQDRVVSVLSDYKAQENTVSDG